MKTLNKTSLVLFLSIVLVVGALLGSQLLGKSQAVADDFSLDEQDATIRAIAEAKPAVVSVMVYDNVTSLIISNDSKKVETKRELQGQGTGFLISSNGWILTNKHVVEVARTKKAEFMVVLNDNRKYDAILIGKDPFNDLAILRIFGRNFPYLKLSEEDDIPAGTTVMAIGNALGKYQNSVTKGIISGLGRTIIASDKNGNAVNLDNVIQTDAEINHGNSGGPLIDLHGKVVGINVAIDEAGSSIGFAIPAKDIKPVIDSVMAKGHIVRPWLGVRYVMINPQVVEDRKLDRNSGALLIYGLDGEFAIAPKSPASRAGLQEGDIIFEINGVAIKEGFSLLSVIQSNKPGDKITLKIDRGGQVITKSVTLEEFTK